MAPGPILEDLLAKLLLGNLLLGAVVTAVLAAVVYAAGAADRSGAVAGWVVGTAIFTGLGWRGFTLLALFIAAGSLATRLGYAAKAARGLAQARGGRRSARHALANTAVAGLCALAATALPGELLRLAFAGALAAALADTAASELGQLWGRRTYLVTTFQAVPAGTDGAISLPGTTAGLAGALLAATVGAEVGLYPWPDLALVAAAGIAGTTADSFLGATLERRRRLGNEAVNLLCTLTGALTAAGLAAAVGG